MSIQRVMGWLIYRMYGTVIVQALNILLGIDLYNSSFV